VIATQSSRLLDPPKESRVYRVFRVQSASGVVGSRGRPETNDLHQTKESVGSSEAQLMAPSVTQTTTLSMSRPHQYQQLCNER
jgi:hypothetical protein